MHVYLCGSEVSQARKCKAKARHRPRLFGAKVKSKP